MGSPKQSLAGLHRMVLASLMAALTAVGAYFPIPTLGPVPIVLATVFVLLSGMLLGCRGGALSMLVYVTVGAMGMPVFSEGRGGIDHLMGARGGYLLGFILAAGTCGAIATRGRGRLPWDILAVVLGTIVIFAAGVPWLRFRLEQTWAEALTQGLYPFLPGAALKGVLVVILARALRPALGRTLEARPAQGPFNDRTR